MTHNDEEFAALRSTIRDRGTVRLILLPVTFGLWAGTAVATTAAIQLPIAALVPLLVLAAGFEAIYALHVNVERIGRYLQVFHEPNGGWEHVAMTFGERFPGRGPDALFSALFLMATALNYLAVLLPGPEAIELSVMAIPHLALIAWLVASDRSMRAQRATELSRLRELYQQRQP